MKSHNPLFRAVALSAALVIVGCGPDRPPGGDGMRTVQAEASSTNEPTAEPYPAPRQQPGAPVVRDSGMSFTDMDKNMDSGITRDELAETEMLRKHFNEADTNGDGQLSVAEVERYRSDMAGEPKPPMADARSFAEVDKNGDGAITIDELWDNEMLARHFDEADTDQDHQLSAAEVDAHRAAMAAGH